MWLSIADTDFRLGHIFERILAHIQCPRSWGSAQVNIVSFSENWEPVSFQIYTESHPVRSWECWVVSLRTLKMKTKKNRLTWTEPQNLGHCIKHVLRLWFAFFLLSCIHYQYLVNNKKRDFSPIFSTIIDNTKYSNSREVSFNFGHEFFDSWR